MSPEHPPDPTSASANPPYQVARLDAEHLAALPPIRAREAMPAKMREMLLPDQALYVAANHESKITLTEARISSSWSRVSVHAGGAPLLGGLPGVKHGERARQAAEHTRQVLTEPHRPAWLDLEYVPRLVPFRQPRALGGISGRSYVEPLSVRDANEGADEALRLSYPWCTIGQVLVGFGTDFKTVKWQGSGVLVGHNLMLTASHLAPWNRGPGQWWMRFVPGRRITDEPHGSSFVEQFYGTYVDVNDDPNGKDYVICRLYTPLGDALGWMGSRSFGDEDDYYNRRFISVGYPGYFGNKPAVEYDIDIDDIDNDGGGLELETTYLGSPIGPGWSGGPLWLWEGEKPYVVGILSGDEKDGLDPRRNVFGGGGLLVDRIKHGIANFA